MNTQELLALAGSCDTFWNCDGACGKEQEHGVRSNVLIALLRVMEAAMERHAHHVVFAVGAPAPRRGVRPHITECPDEVCAALRAAEEEMGK